MKKAKEFLDRHPLISILVFNLVAFPIAVAISFVIRHFTHFDIGNIIFAESMLFLVMCYSSINGNASSRSSFGVYDPNIIGENDYYYGAYHFAIKYGILGASLFFASGFFGMK